MRSLFILIVAIAIISFNTGCKSGDTTKTFCDTACLKDSIKFTGDHRLAPYVYITASSCNADTITWSYKGMGINRKIDIAGLLKSSVHIDKNYIKCFIKDTAYAWLIFNDCASGRGYQVKLPFNKTDDIGRKSGGINNTDPKFAVADGLIAYTDGGNVFVEEIASGKKAQMTFGEDLRGESSTIHEYIDSVNITSTRIWAKVKIKDEWKELQKDISLE